MKENSTGYSDGRYTSPQSKLHGGGREGYGCEGQCFHNIHSTPHGRCEAHRLRGPTGKWTQRSYSWGLRPTLPTNTGRDCAELANSPRCCRPTVLPPCTGPWAASAGPMPRHGPTGRAWGHVLGQKTDLSTGKRSKSLRSIHMEPGWKRSPYLEERLPQLESQQHTLGNRGRGTPRAQSGAAVTAKGHRSEVLEQGDCTERSFAAKCSP